MATYFIDFENIKNAGVVGIERLTPEDEVFIMYSAAADSLKFETLERIMNATAQVHIDQAPTGTKNALDFALVARLGYLAGTRDDAYVIISRDNGFDAALVALVALGKNVTRFTSIADALDGRPPKVKATDKAKNAERRDGEQPGAALSAAEGAHVGEADGTIAGETDEGRAVDAAEEEAPAPSRRKTRRGRRGKKVVCTGAAEASQTGEMAGQSLADDSALEGEAVVATPLDAPAGEEPAAEAAAKDAAKPAAKSVDRPAAKPAAKVLETPEADEAPVAVKDAKIAEEFHAEEAAEDAKAAEQPSAEDKPKRRRRRSSRTKAAVDVAPEASEAAETVETPAPAPAPAPASADGLTDETAREIGQEESPDADSSVPAAPAKPAARRKAARASKDASASSTAKTPAKAPAKEPAAKEPAVKVPTKAAAKASAAKPADNSAAKPGEDASADTLQARVTALLAEKGSAPLQQSELQTLADALSLSKDRGQFYRRIVRALGQKQGLALYNNVKSLYDALCALA